MVATVATVRLRVQFNTEHGDGIFLSSPDGRFRGEREPYVGMEYNAGGVWTKTVTLSDDELKAGFAYKYVLVAKGKAHFEPCWRHYAFRPLPGDPTEVEVHDVWRPPGTALTVFESALARDIVFKRAAPRAPPPAAARGPPGSVHLRLQCFNSEVPANLHMLVTGSSARLGSWDLKKSVELAFDEAARLWYADLWLEAGDFPLEYKFVMSDDDRRYTYWEALEINQNRSLPKEETLAAGDRRVVIRTDDFALPPAGLWHGAGVAVPVFSLRSKRSMGIGEFLDIMSLADWAASVGLCLIQLLPVSDSGYDRSPYGVMSAMALNPVYVNLDAVAAACGSPAKILNEIVSERARLEAGPVAVYETALATKARLLKAIWEAGGRDKAEADPAFHAFVKENRSWLLPHAVFCVFYELFGTPDYSQWGPRESMTREQMEEFEAPTAVQRDAVRHTYFVQWHAHRQLLQASQYAASRGVGLKGDLPIGVNKFSVDTWAHRKQFRMAVSAGAPPDAFAKEGQNWGFPTYNWEVMEADGYSWWKARLARMAQYFHAYRIDHVLGFFRIWEMHEDVAYGVLGRFNPVIPVSKGEILSKGVPANELSRLTEPYIRRHLLHRAFGPEKGEEYGKKYFDEIFRDGFKFKPEYDTMVKVCKAIQAEVAADAAVGPAPVRGAKSEEAFAVEKAAYELRAKERYEAGGYKAKERGLLDFHENVVLLRDPDRPEELFHFRVNMVEALTNGGASSFHELPQNWRDGLRALYHDWIWTKQNETWSQAALKRLRMMMDASGMLVCGEDLGMVPTCVSGVMRDLCLLGLRIQRMSVDPNNKFNDTTKYEYLTVCSPSTHDMAPIRAWWQEYETKKDPQDTINTIKQFYTEVLKLAGPPPPEMTPEIALRIVRMHLESPSIVAIFPLQDLFAIGGNDIRRPGHPRLEMINTPNSLTGCWEYRMHLTLEELLGSRDLFNGKLRDLLISSGRAVLRTPIPPANGGL